MNSLVKFLLIMAVVYIANGSLIFSLFLQHSLGSLLYPVRTVDIYLSLSGVLLSTIFYLGVFNILMRNKHQSIIHFPQKALQAMIVACIILISFGYGMHFATEGLELWSVGTDIEQWIYIVNEPLSHGLFFTFSFVLSSILVLLQINRPFPKQITNRDLGALMIASGIISVLWSYALLEGGSGLASFVTLLLIFFPTVYLAVMRKKIDLRKNPWTIYYIVGSTTTIIIMLSYAVINGGFVQISQLGGL